MTSVEVAAPRTVRADGPGKESTRLESGAGFDEADAGFSQQLASMATDGDGPENACAPRSADGGVGVVVRWWRQQARIDAPQAAPGPVQGAEQAAQAASALLAGNDFGAPTASVPAADPRSGDESDPRRGDGPEVEDADSAARIPAALAGAPTIMPATVVVSANAPQMQPQAPVDPQLSTRPEPPWPALVKDVATEAMSRTVDVKVVGAETHLAPALRVLSTVPPANKPAFAERTGTGDGRKSDQPIEGARPARQLQTLRGQGPEQSVVERAFDQADADMPEPGSNSEGFVQVASLSARGPMHASQLGASPVQQIADRIAAELPAAGPDGARAAPSATSRLAPLEPMKVLTIQLHPADLGTVTVRMTLKADAMDVQVETGRRATARLIDADRDALAGLLRSAGYHVEALTVRAVEQPSLASSPGASQSEANSAAQLQPGGGQADARASGGHPRPEARDYGQVADRSSNDGEQASGERRGTGVYV